MKKEGNAEFGNDVPPGIEPVVPPSDSLFLKLRPLHRKEVRAPTYMPKKSQRPPYDAVFIIKRVARK
jgi:hypothetical protein